MKSVGQQIDALPTNWRTLNQLLLDNFTSRQIMLLVFAVILLLGRFCSSCSH